jgi:hypothetical protein
MRVIGFRSDSTLIVQMEIGELHALSGATGSEFSSKFGFQELNYGKPTSEAGKAEIQQKDIPVSDVFKSANETLKSYEELRKDLQSATSRMSKLTEKMVDLQPKKRE